MLKRNRATRREEIPGAEKGRPYIIAFNSMQLPRNIQSTESTLLLILAVAARRYCNECWILIPDADWHGCQQTAMQYWISPAQKWVIARENVPQIPGMHSICAGDGWIPINRISVFSGSKWIANTVSTFYCYQNNTEEIMLAAKSVKRNNEIVATPTNLHITWANKQERNKILCSTMFFFLSSLPLVLIPFFIICSGTSCSSCLASERAYHSHSTKQKHFNCNEEDSSMQRRNETTYTTVKHCRFLPIRFSSAYSTTVQNQY